MLAQQTEAAKSVTERRFPPNHGEFSFSHPYPPSVTERRFPPNHGADPPWNGCASSVTERRFPPNHGWLVCGAPCVRSVTERRFPPNHGEGPEPSGPSASVTERRFPPNHGSLRRFADEASLPNPVRKRWRLDSDPRLSLCEFITACALLTTHRYLNKNGTRAGAGDSTPDACPREKGVAGPARSLRKTPFLAAARSGFMDPTLIPGQDSR